MKIAKIQLSDGRVAKFEVPDDYTPEQAQAEAHSLMFGKQSAPTEQAYNPADDVGVGESLLIGVGRTGDRLIKGVKQKYYEATGDAKSLSDLAAQAQSDDVAYRTLTAKRPFATALGESLPMMAIPFAGVPQAGASMAARAAISGAAPGLLEYGTNEERAFKGATGGLAGLAGVGITSAAGRALRPFTRDADPVLDGLRQKAMDRGIPLSAADLSGSKPLRWIDSALDNLPFSAERQFADKTKKFNAWNKNIAATFGEDAEKLTPELIDNAKSRIGGMFTDLAERNRLRFTNDTLNKVASHQFDAERFAADSNTKNLINNLWDDILSKVEPDGTISGRAYREFDSLVGKKMRGASNGDVKQYLGDMRDIMRNAMDDSISSADAAAWKQARKQYANMKTVEPLVDRSVNGNITGAGLLQAANRTTNTKKGELGELGRIGKALFSELPDAGTAQRAKYMEWLGGGGAGLAGLLGLANPAIIGGMAAGAGTSIAAQKALWSPAMRNYLVNGAVNLGEKPEKLIKALGAGGGMTLSSLLQQ